MTAGLLLLLALQLGPRRAMGWLELENQQLMLAERPWRDSTVIAYYEVMPRTTREGVEIVFCDFKGVRPVGSDTIFRFNAKEGISRRFAINVEYFSTPATFSVRIPRTHYRLSITRYLMNAATGEYGSLKEIQFKPPVEYRFDPTLRRFEEEVLKFKKDRWHKNRAIIDTIKSIDAGMMDSLCLLLYSDVYRTGYPSAIVNFADKVRYLLEKGWSDHTDEVSRVQFLEGLKEESTAKNEKELKELDNALKRTQRTKFLGWLLSWLIPTTVLSVLLIVLLILKGKIQSKLVTPQRFDVFIRYTVYLLAIGLAIYFAWPYFGISELKFGRMPGAQLVKSREVFYRIRKSNTLGDFGDQEILSKSTFVTESGLGARFLFRDKKHSAFGVEYCFTAEVWPTAEGYQLRSPVLLPVEAIEKFEKNEEVAAYLTRNRIKRAQIVFEESPFAIIVRDTITRQNAKLPLSLDYDGGGDIITICTFLPDFEDDKFPEIAMLSRLLARWGYAIKRGTHLTRRKKANKEIAYLAAFTDVGKDDTLHIYMRRDIYFRYWWSPVPNKIATPQTVLDQILVEFSDAGLSPEYITDNIKLVSSRSCRRPDYFTYDQHDRAIVEATFEWITNRDWVDSFNYGEGARFTVVHEYSAKSLKLGRALGRPGIGGIREAWREITPKYYSIRPLSRIISKDDARAKIFDALPDESGFNTLYIRLNIPEKPEGLSHFLCLVGQYESHEIMVDLESGEIIGPHASRSRGVRDYAMPEIHSFPYD